MYLQRSVPNYKEPEIEAPQLEESLLNKYLVEAVVNVKGQRREIGYIIEANNIEKASLKFDKELKKEYSGIRNITGKKISNAKENDIPYNRSKTENISREPTIKFGTSKNESNEIILDDVKKLIKDDLINSKIPTKIWKVVITPGRRPRQRDFNSNYVYALGDTELDAKKFCCDRLGISIDELKDKWIKMYQCTIDNIIENDNRFIEFCAKEINSNNITELFNNPIDDFTNSLDNDSSSYGELFSNFKNFSINYNKDGYIVKVNLGGVSIIDIPKLKKFKVKLDNFPIFEMVDVDAHNIIAHLLSLFEKESDLNQYKNSKFIEIIDLDNQNKFYRFNLNRIINDLRKGNLYEK